MFSTSMNDFKIEKVLGKGSFGSVYLVTRKEDQKIYALKSVIMEKLNKKEQENSVNEVRILASVNHPNVIGYKEAFWDDHNNTLNIVMEYADDGDLQTKIQKMKKNLGFFEENLIWSYAIQMIEGLKALHDKKIMHRDLKSANIFLVKNKRQCKIGDMNVSKVIKEKVLTTQTGTPYYASPEVWNDKPYSYKSDLWSIGCVIYELCALRPPFKGKDLDELYVNVCKGKVERINKVYSDSLWKMIMMLLQVDVNKRVNCDEFLNHPLIIRKIKEMKEQNIDYKDLEDNKSGGDGCLLNTINFKDLRDIKAQLPTRKNYENDKNNISNNSNNNNNYISFANKKFEFNKNYSDYYKYLNTNINNILNNNNDIINNNIYNPNNNFEYNKILKHNKNINNYEEMVNKINNQSNILNIINDKNINKYNEIFNKIKKQYNFNNNIQKGNIINQSLNSKLNFNYNKLSNLYDHIFHTDTGERISINDKLTLLRNERDKYFMSSDIGLNYEKMNTEDRIMYNDKIMQLKKEKNKILEKQKENYSKTIEEQKNYYKNLLKKLNSIEPMEPKYNYLNKMNNYNNNYNNKINDMDNDINNIEKELKNKNRKLEEKYKILNYIKHNEILKKSRDFISSPEHYLKIDNSKKNKNINHSSSSRINGDYNLPITKITNNKLHKKNNQIKSSSRPILTKKKLLFNNNVERAKTPSLNYNKLSTKNIAHKNKDKDKYISFNSNYENKNNLKSLLNQISTDHLYNLTSLGKQNYLDYLKNNINSTESNPKSNTIKRINKRVVTINKKKKKNNKYNNNTNIFKNKHSSTIPTKRLSKNINFNSNLNIYDINNVSHQFSNHPMNDMNYDFNKYINDINLTNANINENYIKKNKTNINEKPKILIGNDINNIPNRYSTNNITINKKYSITSDNNIDNNNNKKDHKSNNSFNLIKPSISHNNNHNYKLLKNAKKLNVRSNSYRLSGHEKNYIDKKRELDYKYDLTEPEPQISSNLRVNSKNIPKFGNLSLFSNDLDLLGISSTSNGNTFLQNIKSNDVNNHLSTINKANKLSGRYYLNIQNNLPKYPQIFNNYYSFNGVSTSNLPIKVINVYNNK